MHVVYFNSLYILDLLDAILMLMCNNSFDRVVFCIYSFSVFPVACISFICNLGLSEPCSNLDVGGVLPFLSCCGGCLVPNCESRHDRFARPLRMYTPNLSLFSLLHIHCEGLLRFLDLNFDLIWICYTLKQWWTISLKFHNILFLGCFKQRRKG